MGVGGGGSRSHFTESNGDLAYAPISHLSRHFSLGLQDRI